MHPQDRAVSPVIGVVQRVAITVILAAVLGVMALGFESEVGGPTDRVLVQTDYSPSGEGNGGTAYVNITHEAGAVLDGDRVFVADSDGNEVRWSDVWTGGSTVRPGESVHIDGAGSSDCGLNAVAEGEVYRVIHRPGDEERSTVLAKVEIETPPDTVTTDSCRAVGVWGAGR